MMIREDGDVYDLDAAHASCYCSLSMTVLLLTRKGERAREKVSEINDAENPRQENLLYLSRG